MAKSYIRTTPNRYSTIKELQISDNVQGLAQLVAGMAKQLNQRFYRLEKAGVSESSYGYDVAQRETGKDKPRYTQNAEKLAQYNQDELIRLAMDMNAKLVSDTTTIAGLAAIEERRLQASSDKLYSLGIDIEPADLKAFFDAGGAEFLNNKYLDSTQVLDDFVEFTKNGNISTKEFVREYKRYRKQISKLGNDFEYSKITNNLVNLSNRKRAKQ